MFSPQSCALSPHIIRNCASCKFYSFCTDKLEQETGIKRLWYDDGNGSYLEDPVEIVLRRMEKQLGSEEAESRLTDLTYYGRYETGLKMLLAFNRNTHLSAQDVAAMGITSYVNATKYFKRMKNFGFITRYENFRDNQGRKYPHIWMLNIEIENKRE